MKSNQEIKQIIEKVSIESTNDISSFIREIGLKPDDYFEMRLIIAISDSLTKSFEKIRGLKLYTNQTVEDGFGSVWSKCSRPNCDLHVVRPGKCSCMCEDFDDEGYLLGNPTVPGSYTMCVYDTSIPVEAVFRDDYSIACRIKEPESIPHEIKPAVSGDNLVCPVEMCVDHGAKFKDDSFEPVVD